MHFSCSFACLIILDVLSLDVQLFSLFIPDTVSVVSKLISIINTALHRFVTVFSLSFLKYIHIKIYYESGRS